MSQPTSTTVLAILFLLTYTPAAFFNGVDFSWLPQMEAHGYTFKNSNGVQEDLLKILQGYNVNACRVRVFNNPSNDPVNGHCSPSEAATLAVRCKNAAMEVVVDFHYGDTWNSVGKQNPPAAWAHLSYSEMVSAIANFTEESLQIFKSKGVTPYGVQIGNEINSGICHPTGSVSNPSQMSGLLNAAYAASKKVFPSSSVIIHLAQPQNIASIENFYDKYKANNGNWDLSAFSSYGSGKEIPGIVANMASIKTRYNKPVMQVEFGGPETNPNGVKSDLAAYIKGVKGFGGLGVFFWEPEVYEPFATYAMGAWNSTTREPTAALQGFLEA
jgi:arabinogalactan endo-1,4-beta-galactosidase